MGEVGSASIYPLVEPQYGINSLSNITISHYERVEKDRTGLTGLVKSK